MTTFCLSPACGAKITYSGIKPAKCPYCDCSTDPLKSFKPVPQRESAAATEYPVKPAAKKVSSARRLDRWSTEGNVVSDGDNGDDDSGDTLESIGLDKNSFAKVTGDGDATMTVKQLAESGTEFTRPTLSSEDQALKAEALKHMLKS